MIKPLQTNNDKALSYRLGKPVCYPLPTRLRRGMEKLTGIRLNYVRVFYHSPKPAQVKAHAYAQGWNIYLASGQEHHLPHELGHIIQQAKGMVKPTTHVNGVPVNDDPALEQHATELGNAAVRLGYGLASSHS
ncbi:eCIS core domain-containing protein [Marinomonas sp.]|uniref:eCIS core domain-containing protein n=1 Tax=Marinomonas sp. TaxID=1904862 RepID=UPI003BAA0D72